MTFNFITTRWQPDHLIKNCMSKITPKKTNFYEDLDLNLNPINQSPVIENSVNWKQLIPHSASISKETEMELTNHLNDLCEILANLSFIETLNNNLYF